MQASSASSYTVDLECSIPSKRAQAAKHLINTGKVVRGHKLKTQDFIRLQLMRFRYCSPVKYEDQIQSNLLHLSKTTQFADKYLPFQFQHNKQQLHHLIVQQRQKKSKQVANQIKLFATNNNFYLPKQTSKPNFTIKVKPATSQQHRKAQRKGQIKLLSLNKTENILRPPIPTKIQFFSQNLGKRMNDYMNQIVIAQTENQEDQSQQAQVCNNERRKQFQQYGSKDRKVPHISYIKQMKKKFKSKYEPSCSKQSPSKSNYTFKDFALFDSREGKKALQQTFYSAQLSHPNESYSSNGKRGQGAVEKVLPYHHNNKS